MAKQRSLVTATVDFDREGLQHGYLRVPYSHDRSAYGHIPIPLLVARRGIGPTILLVGGIHGDEYEGPVALTHLIRHLPIERLNGRLIIIPALNGPAYLAGTRTSPIDLLNMNRRFPGERNGTPTDMIAHFVETELMPMANYCFDFHAGGASLQYLPTLVANRPRTEDERETLESLLAAFAPPRVLFMDMLGEDRVISAAAERHNVRFLTGEFGGGATLDLDGLGVLNEGLAELLHALGVLHKRHNLEHRPDRKPARRLSVQGPEHYIFAKRPGVFEACFRLGDEVEKGQIAGYIHDPQVPWQAPEEVRFEGTGVALCIRARALVDAGDCLGHLASDEL